MNAGIDRGAMPVNVFVKVRATVTAGFAKLVDDVNQYAAPIYAPTSNGATDDRPDRAMPNTTSTSPAVATISPNHSPPPERVLVDHSTAGSEYMRLTSIAPQIPPEICSGMYASRSRRLIPPKNASARLTTGLRCAPDTAPTARMIAIRPAAVAAEFSNSCSPTLPGDSRCAAMPEPTTTATRRAVPRNSATARRARSDRISSFVRAQDRADRSAASRSGTTRHIIQRPRFSPVSRPASARAFVWWLIVGCDLPSGSSRSHEQVSPPSATRLNSRSRTGSANAANIRASSAAASSPRGAAESGLQHTPPSSWTSDVRFADMTCPFIY